MSSLVVTMTRRSGSGTAGDRRGLWVVEVGAGLLYSLPFSSHGAAEGTLGKRGSGGLCWARPLEGSAALGDLSPSYWPLVQPRDPAWVLPTKMENLYFSI